MAKKKSVAATIRGSGYWTVPKVEQLARKEGTHALGGGLYLRVRAGREKNWSFRYTSPVTGARRFISLGFYPAVGWLAARDAALRLKQQVKEGVDPADARAAEEAARKLENARGSYTVRQAVRDFYSDHKHEWKEGKTKAQWKSLVENNLTRDTLQTPLAQLQPEVIIRELGLLAQSKYETYKKVRQRLNRSFAAAKSKGLTASNPLAEMEHFNRPSDKPVRPRPSLPWREVPTFMPKMQVGPATMTTRLALEWAILSGSRPIEVRRASWEHIDEENRLWCIPGELMKMDDAEVNGDHKVHLTDRHLAILEMMKIRRGPWHWVFPGQKPTEMMSENVFRPLLERLGYKGRVTTHGFRATLKTWAIDRARYDDRLIEAAIAHKEAEMERSYNRSDYWPHRVILGDDWARYCLTGEQPPKTRLQAID